MYVVRDVHSDYRILYVLHVSKLCDFVSLAPREKLSFALFTSVFCSEHAYAIVEQCIHCDYSFCDH